MDVVHFTPDALAYDKPQAGATAVIMPLAAGKRGDRDLMPSSVSRWPILSSPIEPFAADHDGQWHCQIDISNRFRSQNLRRHWDSAAPRRDTCQLESEEGAVIIAVEATKLEADLCGISMPERVAGQQWPSFESN